MQPHRGFCYILSISLDSLLLSCMAASSTFMAALDASFLVGLFLGIISIATAPAAAPKPIVSARPFNCIKNPSFRH